MKRIWTAVFVLLGLGLPVLAQQSVGPIFPAATLSITTGGTWQVLFAANSNRSTLWIQNYCTATSQNITTAESLFIYFLPTGVTAPTTASGPSLGAFELAACGSQVFANTYITKQAVYVVGATTASPVCRMANPMRLAIIIAILLAAAGAAMAQNMINGLDNPTGKLLAGGGGGGGGGSCNGAIDLSKGCPQPMLGL